MWDMMRVWRDLRFRGSKRKRLNSGSRSRSRASFFGAKMVMLWFATVSSSVGKSMAFSMSSDSSV